MPYLLKAHGGHIEDIGGLRIQFCITTIPTGSRL